MTTIDTGHRFGRPDVLRRHFHGPIRFPDSPWQWWLAGNHECAHEAARRMDAHRHRSEGNDGVTTLRERKGRSIFRIHADSGDFFAKEIALPALRKRLGAWLGLQNSVLGHDHGSAEVDNTLTLEQRTHHGLDVLCLGERMRGGLPDRQLLIQPWLDGWIDLGDAFKRADHGERQSLLRRLEALLKDFHHARICHLDINTQNLMVSTTDSEAPLRAIDCAKMTTRVTQPAIATALQIGKMLRELYGREPAAHARLYAQGHAMLRRIAGDDGINEATETLLTLSLRYRLSKNLSRRKMVTAPFVDINGPALEKRVCASYKNADMPSIVWARQSQHLSGEEPAHFSR